ncbi:MAG: hypothetical protein SH868_08225 [Bythopirellula sp.]|nr:hypothetical protein [Bythopirellula sp.]
MSLVTLGKALSAIGLSFVAVGLLGCGEQPMRYPVSGKVMIDGEPLSLGSIRFVPEKGRPVTSAILSDGTFALAETSLSSDPDQKGVAPGKYRVAVSASKVIDEDAGEVEWLAPSKYADFRTSEIEEQIEGPRSDLVIDLTWEGNEMPDAEDEQENSSATSEKDSAKDHLTGQEAASEQ